MVDIDKIKQFKISDKNYNVIYNMLYMNKQYVFLLNDSDDEDIMCLKVTDSDEFGLEKLDSDDELIEVITEFYKREKEELEN